MGKDSWERSIPEKLLQAPCFAFNIAKTGACQGSEFEDGLGPMILTDRGNFEGTQYPTGYYFVASFFAGDNIAATTLSVRIMNSVLFVGLLTALTVALPRRLRLPLVGATFATIIPLGMFLVASANPSSWSIIGSASVFVGVVGFLSTSGSRRIWLGVLSALSLTVALSSRGDSAAYAGMSIVAAMIIAWRPTKRTLVWGLLPIIMLAIAGYSFLSTGQSGLATSGSGFGGPDKPVPGGLMIDNFLQIPSLWMGVFGLNWGLGWLDTPVPAVVWGPAVWIFGAAILMGTRVMNKTKALSTLLVLAGLTVIPLFILYQARAYVGAEVQPRYVLPVMIILVACALLPTATREVRLNRPTLITVWVLLSGANSLGLYANLRRYVNGNTSHNLSNAPQWMPSTIVTPMWFWILSSLAFAIALAALITLYLRSQRADLSTQDVSVLAATSDPTDSNAPTMTTRRDLRSLLRRSPLTQEEAAPSSPEEPPVPTTAPLSPDNAEPMRS